MKNTTTGGKNKRKGSAFERDIAKELSIWIYDKCDVLRRSPSSGAEHQFAQGADVALFQPNEQLFNFYVELKNGYKSDLVNARKQILGWYEKAKENNKKKWPIWIIWKIPRQVTLFISDKKLKNIEYLYQIDNLFIYDKKEVLNKDFKIITA